jgi:hypothetical protein
MVNWRGDIGNLVNILDKRRKEQEDLEKQKQQEGLNLPGMLAGLLAGGIQAGGITPTGVDWSKLGSEQGVIGVLSGGITPKTQSGDLLKDLLTGGLAGYTKAADVAERQKKEAKENAFSEIISSTSMTPEQKAAAKLYPEIYAKGLFQKNPMTELLSLFGINNSNDWEVVE